MHTRIRNIKKVQKRLADGTVKRYHYVRGTNRCIWTSDSPFAEGSPRYLAAIAQAGQTLISQPTGFQTVLDAFLRSSEWEDLAPRTRKDYLRYIGMIEKEFGAVPLAAMEDPRIRGKVAEWRATIPGKRQSDLALTTLVRIVSWAYDRGTIRQHHLLRTKRRWKGGQRADLIWTTEETEAVRAHAPEHVWRAFSGLLETGMRPGDLVTLTLDQVVQAGAGRRITGRSRKRDRPLAIPVSPAMEAILDSTPPGEPAHVFRNSRGAPWTVDGLSHAVRAAATAGGVRPELHLYDARGTACVRFLAEGRADLRTIATIMSWQYSYAAQMMEVYAGLDPALTEAVRLNLAATPT